MLHLRCWNLYFFMASAFWSYLKTLKAAYWCFSLDKPVLNNNELETHAGVLCAIKGRVKSEALAIYLIFYHLTSLDKVDYVL